MMGAIASALYRLTVDQFDRMVADGTIGKDDRLELVEGLLVRKMTKKPAHFCALDAIEDALRELVPGGYRIRREGPLRLPRFSEPEPDLAIVRGDRGTYRHRHPGPGEILLVVEIADSSLSRDRGLKLKAYARAGIPAYWIVNLAERRVELYSRPLKATYGEAEMLGEGEAVTFNLDGVDLGRIEVSGLLPIMSD
jgi:Uma2 family endonuclease